MLYDQECSRCHGEGKIWASRWGGNDPDVWAIVCEECEGSGIITVNLDEEIDE